MPIKLRIQTIACAVFVLFGLGCRNQATNLEAAGQAVVAMQSFFADSIRHRDAVAAASVYTQDAKLIGPGAPAVVGREAIQKDLEAMIRSGMTDLRMTTLQVWPGDGLLLEEGEFVLKGAGGKPVVNGRYLTAWKKENGRWKIFRDVWNSK